MMARPLAKPSAPIWAPEERMIEQISVGYCGSRTRPIGSCAEQRRGVRGISACYSDKLQGVELDKGRLMDLASER